MGFTQNDNVNQCDGIAKFLCKVLCFILHCELKLNIATSQNITSIKSNYDFRFKYIYRSMYICA